MTTSQLTLLKIVLAGRMERRGQRGASAVEWVIITALLIGIAIAVGAIVYQKLTDKATSLNTDTP